MKSLNKKSNIFQPKKGISSLGLMHNFSWNLLGTIVYALTQWGILIVLAKIGTPEMIGLYTFGLAITAPIILFANLQLREVQATDATLSFEFNHYFGLRIVTNFIAILIIVILAFIVGDTKQLIFIIIFVGFAKIFESYSDLFYGLFQQKEVMKFISYSKIIRGFLSLLSIFLIIYYTNNILYGIIGLTLVWALSFIFVDLVNGIRLLTNGRNDLSLANRIYYISPRFSKKIIKNLSIMALPLGIVGVLDTLNLNISRYFIQGYGGSEDLGYFSAIVYLMMIGGTMMAALGQTFTPRLSKLYLSNIIKFKKLLLVFVLISVFIGVFTVIISAAFGEIILTIIYNESYAEYDDLFVWIMIAGSIWYIAHAIWCGITAARVFKPQIPLFLLMVFVSFCSSLILIPWLGLTGAAISIILGMLTRLLGSIVLIRMIIRNRNMGVISN